jgi:hypothetical protein
LRRYEEHIGGSPYTYTVAEGPTDPARSSLDFESRIKANEGFRVVIETNDFHGNPTSHADDVFKCTLDNDDAVEVTRADDGTVVFSTPVTLAATHNLAVVHLPTNLPVEGSPASFEVLPAVADAAASTHNIRTAVPALSIDSAREFTNPNIELTVKPRDRYNNR